MKTYADIIKLIEDSHGRLFVAVFFTYGFWSWLPVDKSQYLAELRMISNATEVPYPCAVMPEGKGDDLFIHPNVENK